MLCVILFGLLTIDVMSFHWFRTFSLWGVKKYYRKSHSFSWLETISNHHWLSLSCSPCALTALEYAWYWHFSCFFCIPFSYRSSPRLSNLLCQGCYLLYLRCSFPLLPFSHLGHTPSVATKKPIWSHLISSPAYYFKTWHCLFGTADFRLLLKFTKQRPRRYLAPYMGPSSICTIMSSIFCVTKYFCRV